MADGRRGRSRLTPLLSSRLQLATPPSSRAATAADRPAKRERQLPRRRGRRGPRAIFDGEKEAVENGVENETEMSPLRPDNLTVDERPGHSTGDAASRDEEEILDEMLRVGGDLAHAKAPSQDRKRAAGGRGVGGAELSPRSSWSLQQVDRKKSKRGRVPVHSAVADSEQMVSTQVGASDVDVVEVAGRREVALKRATSSQTVLASGSLSPAPVVPPRLLRCHASEQSRSVRSASAPPLQPILPTVYSSRHPDLNVITPETVAKVRRGDYEEQLAGFQLLDCRFPFEFEGGSLKGASSLCDPDRMEARFFVPTALESSTRTALIFFCEFSANRAPKMLRHVRNVDRRLHADSYPELYYPELYLIDGGYKNCFETLSHEICPPSALYVRMEDEEFVEACRQEFAAWRRRWKPHKTVATCAAKLEKALQHLVRPGVAGLRNDPDYDRSVLSIGVPSLFDAL